MRGPQTLSDGQACCFLSTGLGRQSHLSRQVKLGRELGERWEEERARQRARKEHKPRGRSLHSIFEELQGSPCCHHGVHANDLGFSSRKKQKASESFEKKGDQTWLSKSITDRQRKKQEIPNNWLSQKSWAVVRVTFDQGSGCRESLKMTESKYVLYRETQGLLIFWM